MSRQLIVTLVILACGLLPARLSGDRCVAAARLASGAICFNRVDLERIEHGYYEQLLDPSRRLDDLADVPDLRVGAAARAAPGRCPSTTAPLVMRVDDVREVV